MASTSSWCSDLRNTGEILSDGGSHNAKLRRCPEDLEMLLMHNAPLARVEGSFYECDWHLRGICSRSCVELSGRQFAVC